MTTWGQANTSAVVKASELHADLDIDLTRPIDVFDAVKELGIVLAFAPLGNVSGVYLPGPQSPGIMLHQGHPLTRQRYSAAHELGHHAFDHALEVDLDSGIDLQRATTEGWPAHEKEAEAFAAWFLMPRKLLRSGLNHLGLERPRSAYDVYALSLWLGTSYTATARQLAVTRLAERQDADHWAAIPPRDLKKSLAGEMVPDDLRNDVWWLDARHHMQPVATRPGDRIVLTLPEIPSSGFSWSFSAVPDSAVVLADSYSDDWEPNLALANVHEVSKDADLAGALSNRAFVLGIDPQASESADPLALLKSQEWDPEAGVQEYELLISVKPPMRGVQIPESDLAIRNSGPGPE